MNGNLNVTNRSPMSNSTCSRPLGGGQPGSLHNGSPYATTWGVTRVKTELQNILENSSRNFRELWWCFLAYAFACEQRITAGCFMIRRCLDMLSNVHARIALRPVQGIWHSALSCNAGRLSGKKRLLAVFMNIAAQISCWCTPKVQLLRGPFG